MISNKKTTRGILKKPGRCRLSNKDNLAELELLRREFESARIEWMKEKSEYELQIKQRDAELAFLSDMLNQEVQKNKKRERVFFKKSQAVAVI